MWRSCRRCAPSLASVRRRVSPTRGCAYAQVSPCFPDATAGLLARVARKPRAREAARVMLTMVVVQFARVRLLSEAMQTGL